MQPVILSKAKNLNEPEEILRCAQDDLVGARDNGDGPSLADKLARMQAILRELESVAVAFSAGVDSTLVLRVALDTLGPGNVVAVTGRSDSLARAEFEQAVELAEAVGAEHVVLDTNEFQNPNYTSNPANRCYFCKTTLYDHMERFLRDRGLRHIVNGINVDDLGDYRPGIQAAREHAVRSPAAEAGLTKADVRELSLRFGLPTFDKPASPCLSSRVPYGQAVTREKLRMIEAAEEFLHSLGFRECRVRHYQSAAPQNLGGMAKRSAAMEVPPDQYRDREGTEDKVPAEPISEPGAQATGGPIRHSARIELPLDHLPRAASPELTSRIEARLKEIGYSEVTIDPRGLRSGNLNEAILIGISK